MASGFAVSRNAPIYYACPRTPDHTLVLSKTASPLPAVLYRTLRYGSGYAAKRRRWARFAADGSAPPLRETKMIHFPPSPRDNFQNYAGLRGQNAASQPYPAFSRNNKPSTCGFIFTAVAMVARQRFSPVKRYSCFFVAFSNTPKSPAKRKKPDLRLEIGLIELSKAEPTRSNDSMITSARARKRQRG